ncbi:MAG: hypothetical protein RMM08_08465 [Armatimonadota bacterium]|nr:hypothetical protein [bacterium]MDW8321382.1 hypothetical protein [Armatimonadota bacterium]
MRNISPVPSTTLLGCTERTFAERLGASLAFPKGRRGRLSQTKATVQTVADYFIAHRYPRSQSQGTLHLPQPSLAAADKIYPDTFTHLCNGLRQVLGGYADSRLAEKRRIHELWQAVRESQPTS